MPALTCLPLGRLQGQSGHLGNEPGQPTDAFEIFRPYSLFGFPQYLFVKCYSDCTVTLYLFILLLSIQEC